MPDPVDLDAILADESKAFGPPTRHPKGWEPGIAWDGSSGAVTTGPLAEPPSALVWAELLADWQLDPETTEIVAGSVQVRGWDANVGGGEIKRLRYYRATIRARTDAGEDHADVDYLCRLVEKRKAYKPPPAVGERALVVACSDWQMGKGEGGGTEATVARICSAIDRLPARIRDLKKLGHPVDAVYLLGMGDLVEGCSGFYPMQTFTVDLDRREQMRLVRRMLLRAVETVAPLVSTVVMAAVPGNHGENRGAANKAFTNWTDNDDLAVVEQVAEVLAANPARYGHVSTVLADDLTLVLDICGTPVGLAHGHQMRGSGHPAARVHKWWEGQALGRQPVADAQVLVTGHLHHLLLAETSGRTHLQCPAMDGGSGWWTSTTGQHSPSGMLTFTAGTGCGPRGWDDLVVL